MEVMTHNNDWRLYVQEAYRSHRNRGRALLG